MVKNSVSFFVGAGLALFLVFSFYPHLLSKKAEKGAVLSSKSVAQLCDSSNRCSQGFDCLKFEEHKQPVCWKGNPCDTCDSKKCEILESYPGQVKCL